MATPIGVRSSEADLDGLGRRLARRVPRRPSPVVIAMGRASAHLAASVATAMPAPLDIVIVHEARPAAPADAPAVGAVAGDGTSCSDLAAARRLGIPEWLLNYMLMEVEQRARADERWIRTHGHHMAGADAILVVQGPASRLEMHAAVRSLFAQGVASVHVLYASLQPDAMADLAALGASLISFDATERLHGRRLPSEGEVRRLMAAVNR